MCLHHLGTLSPLLPQQSTRREGKGEREGVVRERKRKREGERERGRGEREKERERGSGEREREREGERETETDQLTRDINMRLILYIK